MKRIRHTPAAILKFMPPTENNSFPLQQHAPGKGSLPQQTAHDGSVPQPSASFGNAPQSAAAFRSMPPVAVKTESHILTVKEVARMFEAAGVSRIERTIVNWCHPNQFGIARLDAYYDPNERRHLITPQSVERAISEEQARAQNAKPKEQPDVRHDAEPETKSSSRALPESEALEELRFKLRESEISSKVKDQYIAKLEERYDSTQKEILSYSRTLGQLETRLLQLEGPEEKSSEAKRVHVISETEYPDVERDLERSSAL